MKTYVSFLNKMKKHKTGRDFFLMFHSFNISSKKSPLKNERELSQSYIDNYYKRLCNAIDDSDKELLINKLISASNSYHQTSQKDSLFDILSDLEEDLNDVLDYLLVVDSNTGFMTKLKNKFVSNPVEPEEILESQTPSKPKEEIPREDYESIDHQIASKFMQLRKSAMSRNKEFNLTLEDVKELVLKTHCDYTGVEFSTIKKEGETENPRMKTIDRFNPELGYTKDNVFAVCSGANLLKEKLFETNTPTSINIGFENIHKMMKFLKKNKFEERIESNILNQG